MRKFSLVPGKFSQQPTRRIHQMDITPNKQELLERQRKSIQRLSYNPKTARQQYLQWQAKEQKYQQQISKLKAQKYRLQSTNEIIIEKIQQLENYQSNTKILQCDLLIVQMNQKMKQQQKAFTQKYNNLQQRLKDVIKQQNKNNNQNCQCQQYQDTIYNTIFAVIQTFCSFMNFNKGTETFNNVKKQFGKLFRILHYYSEEFRIEQLLQQIIQKQQQQEQQEYRESVMTFPPNSNLKQTFNKLSFEVQVSTNKSEKSFESQFYQGNLYKVKKSYCEDSDGHLSLKKGQEVKLLKMNNNGMWIGQQENGQNIGFFPYNILL